MRFDWPSDEQAVTRESTDDLPMLPEGRHFGTIVQVSESRAKWHQRDANPDGKCLKLVIEVNGYQDVKAEIPVDWRGMIEAACRAARVHPPASGEEWDEQDLAGQSVTFEAVHALAKTSNREYVRVDKWLPAGDPLPKPVSAAAKPPARTPAAKVEAAGQGGSADDIPF